MTAASSAVAKQLGVGKESVRRWVVQDQVDGGQLDLEGRDGFLRRGTRPPQPLIMGFVETMRAEGHAVESICRVLGEQGCQIAARTYRAWRASRQVATRTLTDAHVVNAVRDIAWTTGSDGRRRLTPEGLYGRRKMTAYLRRTTMPDASAGVVDRAMKALQLNGVRRDKGVRTTIPAQDGNRAGDLLITRWFQAHPRFHQHFTPTYSSWINQVERFFGFVTADLLQRSDHRSVRALEADIGAWINPWNEKPRPFIWTKTAEEILESLARLLQRTTGA